jgi:threonine dehydrogenase-like Zn-dependent dehydrogenase
MKAVQLTGTGIALLDVDEPRGEGLVAPMVAASICGTDLGLVEAGAQGFTLGHEMTVRTDDGVFAVEPTVYCGGCDQCRAGYTQRCTGDHANLGIFIDGGLAERVLVPRYSLVALPVGLGPEDGCLVEPAAVAWHGVDRASMAPGMRACVVGGGSIGLMTVAVLVHQGHAVDLDARHRHQAAAGERLGAGTPSGQYDVVFDAAGSASGLARCAELCRPGATLVVLGVYFDTVPIPGVSILTKELTVVGAMAYGRHRGRREVEEAAAMLAARPEVARTLVTHRFTLDEAEEAFAVAADRRSGAIKVVLSAQ